MALRRWDPPQVATPLEWKEVFFFDIKVFFFFPLRRFTPPRPPGYFWLWLLPSPFFHGDGEFFSPFQSPTVPFALDFSTSYKWAGTPPWFGGLAVGSETANIRCQKFSLVPTRGCARGCAALRCALYGQPSGWMNFAGGVLCATVSLSR